MLRPGLLTTVQDRGRAGHHALGVVPGGVMDWPSAALANALVGNEVHEAVLEATILGPELELEADTLVAVCGAEFTGGFPRQRPVLVGKGERVSIGKAERGARAYLAVAGGFDVEPVLGSRSTYLPGRFGGLEGRALRRGDVLPLCADVSELSRRRFRAMRGVRGNSVRWRAPAFTLPEHAPLVLHAMEGQHFAMFDAASQRALFDAEWRISPESNRMGFRLSGPALTRADPGEILSGPVCLGSVQVPANGVPIALMADHQSTGGYPRIAEIASADVSRLAQLAPGQMLRLARCTLETAIELRRDTTARLESMLQAIRWEFTE